MTHRDSGGRAVPCCAGRPLMLLWIVSEAARSCLIIHHLAFFPFVVLIIVLYDCT